MVCFRKLKIGLVLVVCFTSPLQARDGQSDKSFDVDAFLAAAKAKKATKEQKTRVTQPEIQKPNRRASNSAKSSDFDAMWNNVINTANEMSVDYDSSASSQNISEEVVKGRPGRAFGLGLILLESEKSRRDLEDIKR